MKHLPICFTLFTSTKGHWSRRTDWKLTLNHWDRQVPLSTFGARLAHLKITPGEEAIAAEMRAGLEQRGFTVMETVGAWSRGLSHGSAYLEDQTRISNHPCSTRSRT